MGIVSIQYTPMLRVKYVSYLNVGFQKNAYHSQAVVGITQVLKKDFEIALTAFVTGADREVCLRNEITRLLVALLKFSNVDRNGPCRLEQKRRLFNLPSCCC